MTTPSILSQHISLILRNADDNDEVDFDVTSHFFKRYEISCRNAKIGLLRTLIKNFRMRNWQIVNIAATATDSDLASVDTITFARK